MERTRLSSLFVIALLQLSQTEISSTLPESWYAANVINEYSIYSPKPLSEIFSTEATFSSTNPIVVMPKLTSKPGAAFSTSTLPNIFLSTPTERPVTETEVSVVPLSTKQPPRPSPPTAIPVSPQPPSVSIVTATTRPPLPPLPSQPPQLPELPQFQQPQFQQPQFQQPPPPPSPPLIVSIPQGIQIQTASQGSPLLPQLLQNQPPNYFLLYQHFPSAVLNYPGNPPQLLSSSLPPFITSTTLPPSITTTTLPLSSSTTQAPCATNTPNVPHASTQFPTFRIRMVAPSGSVTNVRINAHPTTTTTTTRRPTMTRIHKRNRNNYDGCVSGCGGTRAPICASPLGVSPIDPDTLKGFPSVCHMACNNSFRKNLYEKVMDGKCGRLRTRIRPIDSNNKLKQDDLNKASYTIEHGGPAVVEFSPLTN